MIQPGMMFGGEGPIMQGTWYNPTTGDAFTVRDSFFEDNQYVVTATDGRYFKYDQLQNYIQSDMKLEDLKQMSREQKAKNEIKKENLPAEVSNLIDDNVTEESYMTPEDMAMFQPKQLGNLYDKPTDVIVKTLPYEVPADSHLYEQASPEDVEYNMNKVIIEKALKNASKPNFTISVDWSNYPEKEIEMLKDIMNISLDNICDWYLDNIQLTDFIIKFKEAIQNRVMKLDTAEKVEEPEVTEVFMVEEIPAEEVKDVKEKPKKKTIKKN